ncbi:hypothetical protein, partial [Nostoc sp. 2RC]|uniref:hypothetical protein n=1 Tax=Nostoc sp. 2RC TaxID=2485484 RepID=UPI001C89D4D1
RQSLMGETPKTALAHLFPKPNSSLKSLTEQYCLHTPHTPHTFFRSPMYSLLNGNAIATLNKTAGTMEKDNIAISSGVHYRLPL